MFAIHTAIQLPRPFFALGSCVAFPWHLELITRELLGVGIVGGNGNALLANAMARRLSHRGHNIRMMFAIIAFTGRLTRPL